MTFITAESHAAEVFCLNLTLQGYKPLKELEIQNLQCEIVSALFQVLSLKLRNLFIADITTVKLTHSALDALLWEQ